MALVEAGAGDASLSAARFSGVKPVASLIACLEPSAALAKEALGPSCVVVLRPAPASPQVQLLRKCVASEAIFVGVRIPRSSSQGRLQLVLCRRTGTCRTALDGAPRVDQG